MGDTKVLSNVVVSVNNTAIAYVVGSLKYNEGLGESKQIAQAAGGGAVVIANADDVSTKIGKVSFELLPTASNISLARAWKVNGNANVVKLSASGNAFNKSFTGAAIVNEYEVGLSADGKLGLNFEGNPAV